ncbi:MAG: glycoside hydrolase family 88 protein [Bacillota bacterium]
MVYRIYGKIHRTLKKILRKEIRGEKISLFNIYESDNTRKVEKISGLALVNGDLMTDNKIELSNLFYGENVSSGCVIKSQKSTYTESSKYSKIEDAWTRLLYAAEIPNGWVNSNFLLTGYIEDTKKWCLSSWIWTSAASARYYASINDYNRCLKISDEFIRKQEIEGGWIVRHEYPAGVISKIIAPNDSAYIANNALISAYKITKNDKYLNSALKCANWIINTSRSDGLVFMSQDKATKKWNAKNNIVDIGFTAGLFAELYLITNEQKYKKYCENFLDKYISIFWDEDEKLFHTAIDNKDNVLGGYFARGQAWALEGLIPAYIVFKNEKYKTIINQLITSLLKLQKRTGAWSYNFSHPLMGEDCKGIPVIAKNIGLWHMITKEKELVEHIKKAYDWCVQHTHLTGEAAGGIFSYTIEGAVVHSLYTETAFVYSTAYALELSEIINNI